MPRTARASVGGICHHVINRGNAQNEVFHNMPNHFYLALWPRSDSDLGGWMQWLLTAHVRRYHQDYRSSGHVWQGRFKPFPVEQDEHLLTVLRYVE